MDVHVRVITGAKQTAVQQQKDGSLKVRLTARPIGGKANENLAATLAAYYDVPKSAVLILHGLTTKNKVVRILT